MTTISFLLPDVGEGLDEAEIVRWVIPVGGRVGRDQPVVEIETAKSIVEIPAPADGTVSGHGADEGSVVPVGSLLFTFESDGGAADQPDAAPSSVNSATGVEPAAAPAPDVAVLQPALTPTVRALASPSTRRRARELGIDLSRVTGTAAGGRISRDDVEQAAKAPSTAPETTATRPRGAAPRSAATAPGASETVPLRGLRRQIARAMVESWTTIPHITDIREVNATNLVAARRSLKEHLNLGDVPFTYLPLIVRAVTAALSRVPLFNASIDMDAETITYREGAHIGLATSAPDGLMVPVLKDAGRLQLADIAREVQRLTTSARERSTTPDEMTGGTFSITNFGSYGSWIATPIIPPGQAGILGIGRIQDRVVAVDGAPVVQPTITLCVSGDHRLIDGDSMGAFLGALQTYLTDPILMLDGA